MRNENYRVSFTVDKMIRVSDLFAQGTVEILLVGNFEYVNMSMGLVFNTALEGGWE
jgi:hypothetical protein